MFGSPLAGGVFDATGSYDASFALASIMFTIAGAIGVVLNAHQWQRRRNDMKMSDAVDAHRKLVGHRVLTDENK
jgi:hypothetical protein